MHFYFWKGLKINSIFYLIAMFEHHALKKTRAQFVSEQELMKPQEHNNKKPVKHYNNKTYFSQIWLLKTMIPDIITFRMCPKFGKFFLKHIANCNLCFNSDLNIEILRHAPR